MGMNWAAFLLLILTAWTVVGALGVMVSFRRGERIKARHNMAWIAGIGALYLGIVLAVSLSTNPRPVARGQDQCFGKLCFAVIHTDTMPSYLASHGERVLRVSVRITNQSREHRESDKDLKAYLVDSQGRRWFEVHGLEGVPLTITVAAGSSTISEPVFKVSSDATGLRLVFTHGHGFFHSLRVGDRDSLLHPLVYVPLEQ
jgi:hypothetical protein